MAKKRTPKAPEEIKSLSDDFGNLLVVKNNGKRVIVSLKLVSEQRYRRVGVINIARKTMEVRRNSGKHLFRKMSAYGFNHKLLSDAKLFEKVRLIDEKSEWVIPVKFILDNGKFLNFRANGGFELQIFIPLTDIEEFKRKPKI